MALYCWNCGQDLADVPVPISRHAHCKQCFEALRCCRMCRHFRPGDHVQSCDHERAEPPLEKERANFCDFFRPSPRAFDASRRDEGDAAKARLAALFGESGGADDPDRQDEEGGGADKPLKADDPNADALRKLNDLFDD